MSWARMDSFSHERDLKDRITTTKNQKEQQNTQDDDEDDGNEYCTTA